MIILTLLNAAATWRIYQRMGNPGWAGFIPVYSMFVMFRTLYGSGWKMFLQLIPIVGLFVSIKFYLDLAHHFHQSTNFGWGLMLLNPIFNCILGLGNAPYLDGAYAVISNDPVSRFINSVADGGSEDVKAEDLLAELTQLHKDGGLTDEEYQQKKTELLAKI